MKYVNEDQVTGKHMIDLLTQNYLEPSRPPTVEALVRCIYWPTECCFPACSSLRIFDLVYDSRYYGGWKPPLIGRLWHDVNAFH